MSEVRQLERFLFVKKGSDECRHVCLSLEGYLKWSKWIPSWYECDTIPRKLRERRWLSTCLCQEGSTARSSCCERRAWKQWSHTQIDWSLGDSQGLWEEPCLLHTHDVLTRDSHAWESSFQLCQRFASCWYLQASQARHQAFHRLRTRPIPSSQPSPKQSSP